MLSVSECLSARKICNYPCGLCKLFQQIYLVSFYNVCIMHLKVILSVAIQTRFIQQKKHSNIIPDDTVCSVGLYLHKRTDIHIHIQAGVNTLPVCCSEQ